MLIREGSRQVDVVSEFGPNPLFKLTPALDRARGRLTKARSSARSNLPAKFVDRVRVIFCRWTVVFAKKFFQNGPKSPKSTSQFSEIMYYYYYYYYEGASDETMIPFYNNI